MSFINKKRLTLLTILFIVLIMCIGVWSFMVWKIYNSINDYGTLAKSNAEQESYMTNARKLIGTVNEVEGRYVDLSKNAVGSDGLINFIETLEGLGARSGTSINLGSISVPDEPATIGTTTEAVDSLDDEIRFSHITVPVTAIGEWVNILRLLKLAENLPYALKVDKVRISKSSSGSAVILQSLSSGDALPLKNIGTSGVRTPTKKPAVTSKTGELWSLQFELSVLKII